MEGVLKQYFGFSSLRPYQRDVIHEALNGRDCFVVMATGGGKSLCYQLPPLLTKKTAIVISPLLSLMEDQVMSLRHKGVLAEFLGSTQTNASVIKLAVDGYYDVLYLTPEKALSLDPCFWDRMLRSGICLLAVDEAHCISEWGPNFRREYKMLDRLRAHLPQIPFLALTATATLRVREDIVTSLNLMDPYVFIGSFDRPNLFYAVKLMKSSLNNEECIFRMLKRVPHMVSLRQSTIIYCITIKQTEKVHDVLRSLGVNASIYHGQMGYEERQASHKSFVIDEVYVMVATIAFGMGIDKPDVRCVMHYGCPKSLESYYQESGRCGRDGLPSSCILYYSRSDFNRGDFYCADITSVDQKKTIMVAFLAAQGYCVLSTCRRQHLLNYFDESFVGECGNCDNCISSTPKEKDLAWETSLLLGCVKHCGGRWGLNLPINVLRGSKAKKVVDNNFHMSKYYGKGKDYEPNWWKALGDILLNNGFLNQTLNGSFRAISISSEGNEFLNLYHVCPQPLVLKLSEEMLSDDEESESSDNEYVGDHACLCNNEILLYQALMEVRSNIAASNNAAPYAICSDIVLRNLAKCRPSNEENISLVDGVNLNFVYRYSKLFIGRIKELAKELGLGLDSMDVDDSDSMLEENLSSCSNDHERLKCKFGQSPEFETSKDYMDSSIQDAILNLIAANNGLSLDLITVCLSLEDRHDEVINAIQHLESSCVAMSEKDSGSVGSGKSRRSRLSKGSNYHTFQLSHGNNSDQSSSNIDGVSVLSSPMSVFNVVSSFDTTKRNLVESIGFGGILSLSAFSEENKSFYIWLLKRINWNTGSLAIGDNFSITLTPHHIGMITGLNHTGIDVADNALESVDDKLFFIRNKLSFLPADMGIVKGAESFVKQEFPTVVTNELADNFKIAFVIFVIGRFLAPSYEHPDGHTNFWGALQDPNSISTFNWSCYVLSNLLESARLLTFVTPYSRPINFVVGCPLLLQIFYLDNIDLGCLNLSHELLPRWHNFSNESINAMIQADTTVKGNYSSSFVYGKTKLIRQDNRCYTFGNSQIVPLAPIRSSAYPPIQSKGACPSSSRRRHKENTSRPLNSSPETSPKLQTAPTKFTIFNTPISFEKDVLDFSAVIRNKYQGQVDSKLLDNLKLHNASCLRHISKSYRSLASDIVNENISIATKIVEQHSTYNPKDSKQRGKDVCPPRRRSYNDYIGGTDSSTDGEEGMSHMKVHRSSIPISSAEDHPNVAMEIVDKHNHHPHAYLTSPQNAKVPSIPDMISPLDQRSNCSLKELGAPEINKETDSPFHITPLNAYTVKDSVTAEIVSDSHSNPIFSEEVIATDLDLYTKGPVKCINSTSIAGSSKQSKDYMNSLEQFSMHSPISIRNFDTPEATIKMRPLSPKLSPTTENKLFSSACVSIKVIDSFTGIDLNNCSFEAEYNRSCGPKRKACPGPFSRSPWDMKLSWPVIALDVINSFSSWVSTTTSIELGSDWIVHSVTRFLKISGIQLKDELVMFKPLTFDIFDVAIRIIIQLDRSISPSENNIRWRHLLESDYAMHVLGDENPVENKFIRDQFAGTHVDYELCRCRMFFVPVFVNGKWWCYGWDLKCRIVYIIDPSIGCDNDALVIRKHSGTIIQLSDSLTSIARDLYDCWAPNFTSFKTSVLRFTGMPFNSHATGIVTLFAIINFDGSSIVVQPTESILQNFRAELLYRLIGIKDNCGRCPSGFVHYID